MVDEGHHVWVQPVGAQGRVEAFLAVGTPRATLAARPDRRGPCAQLVRDRVGEVSRRGRGRATAAGRFLRRAGARRTARGRSRSRTRPLRVRPRRAGLGRGDRGGRRRARPDPTRRSPPRTHCSRLEGGFLVSAHAGGINVLLPAAAGSGPRRAREGARPSRGGRAPRRRGRAGRSGRCRRGRSARRAMRCRCAGWKGGSTPDSNSSGTYRLLLSMAEPDALRAFAEALLGAARCLRRASTAASSCRACRRSCSTTPGGRRRRRELFVHRHTLRYRDAQGRGAHRSRPVELASTAWSSGSPCVHATCRRPSPRAEPASFIQVVQRTGSRAAPRWVVRCDRNARYWRSERIPCGHGVRPEEGPWRTVIRCSSAASGSTRPTAATRDIIGPHTGAVIATVPGGHGRGRGPRRRRGQEGVRRDLVRHHAEGPPAALLKLADAIENNAEEFVKHRGGERRASRPR